MSLPRKESEKIVNDILDTIIFHPEDVVNRITKKYSLSKQTIYNYMKKLEKDRKIETIGIGKGKAYQLKETKFVFNFSPIGLSEDQVWIEKVLPVIPHINKNVNTICSYGFTEMLNNAIDHANSSEIKVIVEYSPLTLRLIVKDDGIGIFNKIQEHLGLSHPKYSTLELAKGKLTSDPTRHSGEGIFFTSRVFDKFLIWSGELVFTSFSSNDWLFEDYKEKMKGTMVVMIINFNSDRVLSNVFDEYTDPDTQGFTKTIIPVKLMKYEGMELISRSQAKRLINRFDRFREVCLDFNGVEIIGQAFADELFRVFAMQNPDVHLKPVNTNETVQKMIMHVLSDGR